MNFTFKELKNWDREQKYGAKPVPPKMWSAKQTTVSALVLEGDCIHLYGLLGQSSSQEMTASLDYSLLVTAHSSYLQGGLSC